MLACIGAAHAQVPQASSLDAAKLQAMLGPDLELVQRIDAQLNDDREIDTIYLARGGDGYRVGVILAYRSEGEFVHDALHPLALVERPELALREEVLIVHRPSMGTSATTATLRYRYDPHEHEMLLIGLDAGRDGGIGDNTGLRLDWNLLTGEHLVWRGRRAPGVGAVDPDDQPERSVRTSKPVWMVHTPDPDALLDAADAGESRG
ncbi:MAG TPA: hypothetical protein PK743_11880 [Luteimonas sp.]|nr:hypothetical protein [Luteimonas sp.]